MVYAPQRRHAVSLFTHLNSALSFVQYLYSPNILILIARVLIQSQIINSHITHPGRSLFGLGSMLTFTNIMAATLHSIDFMTGMNGGRGIILDFVGQSTPASLGRILLLDFIMWICQLVSLELIYITAHSGNIPQSSMFPYPDYLLPPTYSHSAREAELSAIRNKNEEDVEDDVESGLKRRRKRGFESAFEELDGEMDALWLNDDDGPGGRPRASSTSRLTSDGPDLRIREPPLVFSLSFIHIFTLVFHLPLPNPPPAAFAGGTPNPTPPVTPGVETTSPQIQPRTLARVVETDIDSSRIQRELDQGEDERTRTMPGDFRNTDSRE